MINIGENYKKLGLCTQIGLQISLNFHSTKDHETSDFEGNLMDMLYARDQQEAILK